MKKLNKESTKTMVKLIGKMEDGYAKIDNGGEGIMAVSIEDIGTRIGNQIISVAHYYKQNGDLMADPEVTFMKIETDGNTEFFPLSYKQASLGMDREYVIFEDEKIRFDRSKQNDLKNFCNNWFKNIADQQKI